MAYVQVSAEAIEKFLTEKKFERSVKGNEVVYTFRHKARPDMSICVWTSIKTGAAAARGCGKDAIRVTLVYTPANGREQGIHSEQRVHRTGTVDAVLARMYERMRSAYAKATAMPECGRCGAPCFLDSGKCVDFGCRKFGGGVSFVKKGEPTSELLPPGDHFFNVPEYASDAGTDDFNAKWAQYKNEYAQKEIEMDQATELAAMKAELAANGVGLK